MDPKADDMADKIRKQIDDVNSSLASRREKPPTSAIADAKHNIEQLLEHSTNPREVLYKLPAVLRKMSNQKLLGVFLINNARKTVLHNGKADGFWPFDFQKQSIRTDCFYSREEASQLVAEKQLPWIRSLSGEITTAQVQLLARAKDKPDLLLEVYATRLASGTKAGEVVVLFRDITEVVKAEEYLKNLYSMVEHQVVSLESAQRELKLFADKLGLQSIQASNILLPPAASRAISNNVMQPECVAIPASGALPILSPHQPPDKRVLVVDDIALNQKMLCMHLQKLGVSTDIAENGLEAVNACKQKRYAIVFMDLDMPVMNGLEATIDIRKFENTIGVRTPIIAMTSFSRPGDKERCLQAGMDEFLEKGDGKTQLKEVVGHYVFGESKREQKQSGAPEAGKEPDRPPNELDFGWIKEALGTEPLDVVSQFIGTASLLLDQLQVVINDKNSLQVTHVAYSLKGPCSNLGLKAMGKLCTEIADDAFIGRWADSNDKLKLLRKMFTAVQDHVVSDDPTRSNVRF